VDATTGETGRGFRQGFRTRSSPLRFAHQSRRRFAVIVLGCWTIGFFGISDGRFSLVQLAAVSGALLLWFVAGARRRRVETARERWILSGHPSGRQTTNVRRLDAPR
jgi:hypothetical protein